MGWIRNCEKCDFNHMCLVKDADNCPFDNPMTYAGEPVDYKYEENKMRQIAHMPDREAADISRKFLGGMQFPRGNGKTTQSLKLIRGIRHISHKSKMRRRSRDLYGNPNNRRKMSGKPMVRLRAHEKTYRNERR